MVLIPMLRQVIDIPIIAAGGIASGKAIYAAMTLGADGVQIGSLFAVSKESSAHDNFKQSVFEAGDGQTKVVLKSLVSVRLIKNEFYRKVEKAESEGASREQLAVLLGKGRAKMGMFEGDTIDGELEIGQVSAMIDELKPVQRIIDELVDDFNKTAHKKPYLI